MNGVEEMEGEKGSERNWKSAIGGIVGRRGKEQSRGRGKREEGEEEKEDNNMEWSGRRMKWKPDWQVFEKRWRFRREQKEENRQQESPIKLPSPHPAPSPMTLRFSAACRWMNSWKKAKYICYMQWTW